MHNTDSACFRFVYSTVFVVSPGPANIFKCSHSLKTVVTMGDGFIRKMCGKLVPNVCTWNAKKILSYNLSPFDADVTTKYGSLKHSSSLETFEELLSSDTGIGTEECENLSEHLLSKCHMPC